MDTPHYKYYQYLLLILIEFQEECQGGEAAAPPELTTLELLQNLQQIALKMIRPKKTNLRYAFFVRTGMRNLSKKQMCGYPVPLVNHGGM